MNKLKHPYVYLVGLHILLGFVIFLIRPLGQLYFLASLGLFTFYIFKNKNKNNEALLGAAYMVGGEVFFRMTGSAIVYEAGKYSVIAFIFLGLFFSGTSRKSGPYWLYLLLLIPGIILAGINLNYGTDFRKSIIFNISGPFCLGIASLYCMNRTISYKQLQYICWALLMPVITMAVFLYFYTPDTRDVLSGTGSNRAASGGFGPNQVATALGLGMFVITVQLFVLRRNLLIVILNLGLLSLISYRAIVTFSRGGVITALVIILAFLFIYYKKVNTKVKTQISITFILLLATGILTWGLSSSRTYGLIDKRYANKDAAGRIKEDITTGRTEILSTELEAFYKYPITGLGVGKIKEYRALETGIDVVTHNEVSRLLSEHGLAGLIALAILIITPLLHRIKKRNNYLFFSFLGFWFLTINHSSMRIAAPALLYSLSLLNVTNSPKQKKTKKV